MGERSSALEQLERILYVLPAAERDDGVAIAELCSALGVTPATLMADVDQVGSRLYYFPAAWAEDISIDVDMERIRVRSGGKFARPRRLSPREALALTIGLRRLALESDGEARDRLLDLAASLDRRLSTVPAEDVAPHWSAADSDGSGDGVRAVLRDAVRDHRACAFTYMKATGTEVTDRRVHPYLLAVRAGTWYVIGYCTTRQETRSFRLDRIIDLTVTSDTFEVSPDFDAASHLHDGRVYTPDDPVSVVVQYSAAVAGWLREQGEVIEQGDGSVLVSYNVSDPEWIVRLVLRYGTEAELLEPAAVREQVREALARVASRHETKEPV